MTRSFLQIATAWLGATLLLVSSPAHAAQPLPRSTPEAQGVSSAVVREFVEAADKAVDTMHSFMLVRHGQVIAECWWKPESAEKPHVLYSLSKSFTSTAVGLAAAEGKLSIDDPVLKFFPDDAPAEPSDKLKAMRVRDLLTMSTGHQSEPRLTAEATWVKSFLAHPVEHKPGAHFLYNSAGTYTCSAIVQKVTGQTVLDYLRPRLFEPLGIESAEWSTSPQGISAGGWGLFLKTEDIAKFGQLLLQRGKWNGQQLVPAEWIAQATARQVSNGSDPTKDWDQGYGFQFWRCRHNAFRGDGAFGQFCIVLPEQDAVIAITADTKDMPGELNIVWEKLFPAFQKDALPENADERAKLKTTLANLAVREGHKANFIKLPGAAESDGKAVVAVDSVAAQLRPFVEQHALAGAVALVVDRDKVLSLDAVGFADVAKGTPMKTDSLFWIASQSKPITATGVMMLVDEGKIALDDPVEKYLPEFRGQMVVAEKDDAHALLRPPAHPITVREVLSHMSGLPFSSAVETPTLDALPLATAVRSYAGAPLQTEPGTHYQYSNEGINTAARIIEVVTKMKYEEFMQKRLFEPLGMKETTFWPSEEQARRVAKSYKANADKNDLVEMPISQLLYPLSDRTRRFPMPAGGLFSTAQDTAQFCRMLLRGGELDGRRYLSEAAFHELTKRQTPNSVKDSYGLGCAVGGDWFGHGGAQATNMEIRPAQGLAVVWMVQHAGFPGEGGKAQGVFRQWAVERFGKAK